MDQNEDTHLSSIAEIPNITDSGDPSILLRQALLAHWERRYPEAERLYQQVLAVDSVLVSARIRYATLLLQQDRIRDVVDQLQQASSDDPQQTHSYLQFAHENAPDDVNILNLIGLYFFCRNDLTLAEEYFTKVENIDKKNIGALLGLAKVWGRRNDNKNVRFYLERARELAHGSDYLELMEKGIVRDRLLAASQELFLDAQTLVSQQQYQEAEKKIKEILQKFPDHPDALALIATVKNQQEVSDYLELAQDYLQKNEYSEALQQAKKALALEPTSVEAQGIKDKVLAVQSGEKLLQYLNEAENLDAQDDFRAAIRRLEDAKDDFPDDEEVKERLEALKQKSHTQALVTRYVQEANQNENNDNLQRAIDLLDSALQLTPENTNLLQERERLINSMEALPHLSQARELVEKDPEAALQILDQVRSFAPDLEEIAALDEAARKKLEVNTSLNLASQHRSEGRFIEACQSLMDALSEYPADPVLEEALRVLQDEVDAQIRNLMTQGQSAEQEEDFEAAKEIYQSIFDISPENVEAQEMLEAVDKKFRVQDFFDKAQTLYQTSEYEEAIQTMQAATDLVPDDEKLQAILLEWKEEIELASTEPEAVSKSKEQLSDEDAPSYCLHCGYPARVGAKFCNKCGKAPHSQKCPNCRSKIRPNSKFCVHCGKPLIFEPLPEKCTKCGAEFSEQARFCRKCGQSITDEKVAEEK